MRIRIVAIGILLLLSAAVLVGQNGNDLYQQGLAREAAGDIQGAIQIFERIVRDFSSNRTLTARALLQLGRWSDLLGRDQARRYYERVVKDFSDQTNVVTEAKKRLNDKPNTPIEIKTPFTNDPWSFALSPDGRSLVFVATVNGKTSLWLHDLASGKQAPIPGTESTRYAPPAIGPNPFWSQDSRFIGYFDDQKLKKIPVGGVTPTTLAEAPANAGGTWNKTGDIVFAPSTIGRLYSVSAEGGNPVPVVQFTGGAQRYPRFLSDGRQFLAFLTTRGSFPRLLVGSLDSPARELPGELDINAAAVVPPDRFVYLLEGVLYARTLDLQNLKLTGPSVRLAERVVSYLPRSGYSALSVSAAGPIAYRADSLPRRKLLWRDRSGREASELAREVPNVAGSPSISPDGKDVALRINTNTFTAYTFLMNLTNGRSQLLNLGSIIMSPSNLVWSPRGGSLVASGMATDSGSNSYLMYEWQLGDVEPRRRLLIPSLREASRSPLDWQGEFLLFNRTTRTTSQDVFAVKMSGNEAPIPVAATSANETNARFSPDVKWIAYESDEIGGRNEIFVQSFPGSVNVRRRISISGGSMPEWRRDGRELYFMSPDNHLMAAAVVVSADGTDIEMGKPAPLFTSPLPDGSTYAPAPDGQRFLISQPIEAAPPIIILPNTLGGKP